MKHISNKSESKTIFKVQDYRRFGQKKLSKPKELRGIKQAFSVEYNPKCRCQVFIKDNDVWVKHRDYFSPSLVKPEHHGLPLNTLTEIYLGKERPNKFIYEDAWGDIIARCEAWIKLENLMFDIKEVFPLDTIKNILRQQERVHSMEEYELEYTYSGNYMVRFWETVVLNLKNIKANT